MVIHTIADLESRFIPPEQYEVLWRRRCQVMRDVLAKQRADHNGIA